MKSRKRENSDKYLIAEQKGWRILFLGLLIATLFSLTFRAVFSPKRIQYEIERVLSTADSRIKTTVMGAHLSLSDGIWPRLAIVIDSLKLETNDPCLYGAKAQIENLEFPVALSSLMDRHLIFKRIEVGQLKLIMKSKRDECVGNVIISPANESQSQQQKTIPSSELSTSSQKTKALDAPPLIQTMSVESSLLKHIIFHHVQFQIEEWPLLTWNLKNVDVHLPTNGETKTHIEGLITLSSDPVRFPLQGINAHLEMDSEVDKAVVKITGAWREGRLDFSGYWLPKQKEFKWKGQFKQIPWGQVLILAQILGQKEESIPITSQSWLSGTVEWEHLANKPEHIEMEDVRIEGEVGDFLLGKLMIDQRIEPKGWHVSPYKLLAKEVNIDLLTKILGWKNRVSAFDKFGFLNGEADFVNNELVNLEGQWKDLHIIFSNRGRRVDQVVKHIDISLKGASSKWEGMLKNIELKGGHWGGDISIKLDQHQKLVEVETQFDQVKLNQDVESLMTLNGELSPLEGKLAMHFLDGRVSHIKGTLKFDKVTLNDVMLEKPRIDFDGSASMVEGKVLVQTITTPKNHLEYWPIEISDDYEFITIKNLAGDFSQMERDFIIKDLQGTVQELKAKFHFNGKTISETGLQGNLGFRSEKKNLNYILSGTRTNPEWAPSISK